MIFYYLRVETGAVLPLMARDPASRVSTLTLWLILKLTGVHVQIECVNKWTDFAVVHFFFY